MRARKGKEEEGEQSLERTAYAVKRAISWESMPAMNQVHTMNVFFLSFEGDVHTLLKMPTMFIPTPMLSRVVCEADWSFFLLCACVVIKPCSFKRTDLL